MPPKGNYEHVQDCPMHASHRCAYLKPSDQMPYLVRPDGAIGHEHWVIVANHGVTVRIDFCPWCSDSLPPITCRCDAIREDTTKEVKLP